MKERVGKGLFHQAGNLRSPIALCGAVAAYSNGTLVVSNRYDRRVQKIAPDCTHTFLYDGWRPVVETVERPGGATDRIEYYWGRDLSGTLDGAAGVGGLLYVKCNDEIYVPFYDAYGNVMGYWDEQGNVVAEYAYDAFGRTVAKNGTMADVFSIRYSTKYYDAETGMYYYGRRFYLLALCRWLTRDPIEEEGGVNLYGFCGNGPAYKVDYRGMFEMTLISDDTPNCDVLYWYLCGGTGNRIKSNLHSTSDMIDAIEKQILRENSLITVLNVSGHGLGLGAGVSFSNGESFDLLNQKNGLRTSLSAYLAPNAVIKIWSCEAASTSAKCRSLQSVANDLNVEIYAKAGDVGAGPDGGALSRTVDKVVDWVLKSDQSKWKVFKPRPRISGVKYVEGPQAYKIYKRENRTK